MKYKYDKGVTTEISGMRNVSEDYVNHIRDILNASPDIKPAEIRKELLIRFGMGTSKAPNITEEQIEWIVFDLGVLHPLEKKPNKLKSAVSKPTVEDVFGEKQKGKVDIYFIEETGDVENGPELSQDLVASNVDLEESKAELIQQYCGDNLNNWGTLLKNKVTIQYQLLY